MTSPDWIAAEHREGRLRLWQMAEDGTVLAQSACIADAGEDLSRTLSHALPGLAPGTQAVLSGAATLPFAAVPCAPPTLAQAQRDGDLHRLPGIAQERPVDVLHGEETRVAGFLALNPRFDGVICLPGAQSRWVHVSAGEIVSFRSFLTGTLFDLLGAPEALGVDAPAAFDEEALLQAADQAMGRPANFAGELAVIRAERQLSGLSDSLAASRAMGLLVGMELAAAKPYWLGQSVAIVAEGNAAQPYRLALEAQAVPVVVADGARMALEGLKAARKG
ncbi:2-dehydro-3-deoxygalactonokinase [Salipiger bermudensis]|uniref:2-dehydro-3-deoxygalactonokinase n=1 Tax=Salipiger bermudensis TaxID=344736 RepID=UPI001CD5A26B|nr:2-dehydro-3-deoxygalactonokinase [Salipiger bermudensis]MCA0961553.1 2-dehydro-3-deoxygalactonokinase [Salipiger bermudensis]